MQESISICLSVIFLFIMTPKCQQEIGWPPIHCACYGGAWQISTLQKYWISMDVCLIKTAWPFPDLASRRLWYNGTFIRLSGTDNFSSDLPFSFDARVYLIIIQFHTFWRQMAVHPTWSHKTVHLKETIVPCNILYSMVNSQVSGIRFYPRHYVPEYFNLIIYWYYHIFPYRIFKILHKLSCHKHRSV